MADDKEPHAAGSDRAKESTKEAKARLPRCLPTLCAVPQCHSGFALGACRLSAVDMPAGTTCKGVWLGRGICARSDEIGTSANDVPRQSHATTDSQPSATRLCGALGAHHATYCTMQPDDEEAGGCVYNYTFFHVSFALVSPPTPHAPRAHTVATECNVGSVGRWHRTT